MCLFFKREHYAHHVSLSSCHCSSLLQEDFCLYMPRKNQLHVSLNSPWGFIPFLALSMDILFLVRKNRRKEGRRKRGGGGGGVGGGKETIKRQAIYKSSSFWVVFWENIGNFMPSSFSNCKSAFDKKVGK